MKPTAVIFAAALMTVLASPAPGQSALIPDSAPVSRPTPTGDDDIRRYESNYAACLNNGNDGVVESAIAMSVRMKWALPSAQLEPLRRALASVAADGKTASIRYKASLAGLVFDAPPMFNNDSARRYAWDEDLFSAISERARHELLGSNGPRPVNFPNAENSK